MRRDVRLKTAPSKIHGVGLFADECLEDGFELGWMSGRVVFEGSRGACEDWALARAQDRNVLLRHGAGYTVVDVTGSVFEWANCATDEHAANMHVLPSGRVEACSEVESGEELVWFYGELFGLGKE